MTTPLPHSNDAEREVLGYLLLHPSAYYHARAALDSPEVFFNTTHRAAWRAICSILETDGETALDALILHNYLESKASAAALEQYRLAGGLIYLSALSDTILGVGTFHRALQVLVDLHLLRRLSRWTVDLQKEIKAAGGGGVDALLARGLEVLGNHARGRGGETVTISSAVAAATKQIERMISGEAPTLWFGCPVLDPLIRLRPRQLVFAGARPSVGKTAFALWGVTEWCRSGKRGGIHSLEMGREELVIRLAAAIAGVDGDVVQGFRTPSRGDVEDLNRALNEIASWDLYIDDRPGQTLYDVEARARTEASEGGIDFLVVDYVQLMKGTREDPNRLEALTRISAGLKGVARTLDTTVLALAQLNRKVDDRRADPWPKMSDLKDCGAFEQDADKILLFHRDETEDGVFSEDFYVNLGKDRQGGRGRANIYFDGVTQRFSPNPFPPKPLP